MADDPEAEIREIKLKIENLLVAANYSGLPQAVTVAYLRSFRRFDSDCKRSNVKAGEMAGKPSEAQIKSAAAARQSRRSYGHHQSRHRR